MVTGVRPGRSRGVTPIDSRSSLQRGLVTVAIPTYNGSRYLRDALDSALRQTYEHIEIMVVDDVSEDESAEIAEQFGRAHPERTVRVERNRQRLGLAANWNRCIELARGEYVKFLFQDDLLEPECVAELVGTIDQAPTAGMAFAPRAILVDGPHDVWIRLWMARHAVLHTRFTRLDRLNDGGRLFREQMARDPFRNWIGEPTVVLLRTEHVRQAGGFNPRLKQLVDVEGWLRVMCRGEVGFVDRPLASYRLHGGSTTSRNVLDGAAWLDPLWMVESLLADDCVRAGRPRAARLRIRALLRVMRGEVVRVMKGRRPAVFNRAGEVRALLRR